jgi:hypothetical protein
MSEQWISKWMNGTLPSLHALKLWQRLNTCVGCCPSSASPGYLYLCLARCLQHFTANVHFLVQCHNCDSITQQRMRGTGWGTEWMAIAFGLPFGRDKKIPKGPSPQSIYRFYVLAADDNDRENTCWTYSWARNTRCGSSPCPCPSRPHFSTRRWEASPFRKDSIPTDLKTGCSETICYICPGTPAQAWAVLSHSTAYISSSPTWSKASFPTSLAKWDSEEPRHQSQSSWVFKLRSYAVPQLCAGHHILLSDSEYMAKT